MAPGARQDARDSRQSVPRGPKTTPWGGLNRFKNRPPLGLFLLAPPYLSKTRFCSPLSVAESMVLLLLDVQIPPPQVRCICILSRPCRRMTSPGGPGTASGASKRPCDGSKGAPGGPPDASRRRQGRFKRPQDGFKGARGGYKTASRALREASLHLPGPI